MGWTNSTHVLPIRSSGVPQTVHMYSQFIVVGWSQTVHVSLVLHTVPSCALLAQLVIIISFTKQNNNIEPKPVLNNETTTMTRPTKLLQQNNNETTTKQQ